MEQAKKKSLIVLLDCLSIAFVGGLALLTRFEYSFNEIPRVFVDEWLMFLPLQIGITVIFFWWR